MGLQFCCQISTKICKTLPPSISPPAQDLGEKESFFKRKGPRQQ